MKNKIKTIPNQQTKIDAPGYPYYSEKDDIYAKSDEVENNTNLDALMNGDENDNLEIINNNDLQNTSIVENLDVPGAELDDAQEYIGSEDEENNYYSIGGDNHQKLEERDEN